METRSEVGISFRFVAFTYHHVFGHISWAPDLSVYPTQHLSKDPRGKHTQMQLSIHTLLKNTTVSPAPILKDLKSFPSGFCLTLPGQADQIQHPSHPLDSCIKSHRCPLHSSFPISHLCTFTIPTPLQCLAQSQFLGL